MNLNSQRKESTNRVSNISRVFPHLSCDLRSPSNSYHPVRLNNSHDKPQQTESPTRINENPASQFSQEQNDMGVNQHHDTANDSPDEQGNNKGSPICNKDAPTQLDKDKEYLFRVVGSAINTNIDNYLIEIMQKMLSHLIDLLLELLICHGEKNLNWRITKNMSVMEKRNILYLSDSLSHKEYHDISVIHKLRNEIIHNQMDTSFECSIYNKKVQSLCSNDNYIFRTKTNRGMIINSFIQNFCSLLIRIEYYYLHFNPNFCYSIHNPNIKRLLKKYIDILHRFYIAGKKTKVKDTLEYDRVKLYIKKTSSYARKRHKKYDINNLEYGSKEHKEIKCNLLKDLGPWTINDKKMFEKNLYHLFEHLLRYPN